MRPCSGSAEEQVLQLRAGGGGAADLLNQEQVTKLLALTSPRAADGSFPKGSFLILGKQTRGQEQASKVSTWKNVQ